MNHVITYRPDTCENYMNDVITYKPDTSPLTHQLVCLITQSTDFTTPLHASYRYYSTFYNTYMLHTDTTAPLTCFIQILQHLLHASYRYYSTSYMLTTVQDLIQTPHSASTLTCYG